MVELLAPAGSKEALIAAVESGANAVYLAGNLFGARAYANNFDADGLKEAIRFAHLRNVLINVTVNTIVSDDEIPALRSYLKFLYEAGADAVLVQDLGVAKIAREEVPALPLHASTQMTVHSLEGVLALEKLGFTRVVLSRELSLAEIKYICKNSKVEIEVFMHGALCVCYSGQCLMSSIIGGRSGNRGKCAQPCRLPYTLVDEQGKDVLGDKAGKYLLSPRDLSTIDIIPDLITAGVASLKIEGRMKRPEYVATVVGTYRRAIDKFYSGVKYEVSSEDYNNLKQIFNRDFTTAYLLNRPGKNMMSDRRPNNRGLLIGRVLEYHRDKHIVTVKLTGKLNIGDQLDFWVKVGGRVTTTIREIFNKKGDSIATANAGETVAFALNSTVHTHDRIFKVYDAVLMENAKAMYQSGAPVRRIWINAEVNAAIDKPLAIKLTDTAGNVGTGSTNFIGVAAQKRPLTADVIRKQVDRLGSTVYKIDKLSITIDGDVMVPMSEINEARRIAVENLDKARLQKFAKCKSLAIAVAPSAITNLPAPSIMVAVDSIEKLKIAINAGAKGIIFGGESYTHKNISPEDYKNAWQIAAENKVRIDFNLPRIVRDNQAGVIEKLLISADSSFRPAAIHVHNIATASLVKRLTTIPLHAGFSLTSYNSEALNFFYQYGISSATLSPELNLKQIEIMAAASPIKLMTIVSGRLELMVSDYCVLGSFLGNIDKGVCSQPCKQKKYFLKDRKETIFPVVTDQFCRMHILNSKLLSMLPYARKLLDLGISSLIIDARSLDDKNLIQTIKAYNNAANIKSSDYNEFIADQLKKQEITDITRGHFFRGV